MSNEIVVIKIFSVEMEAVMAQQILDQSGIMSFVSKDDAGGMEPHLQRTGGIRLLVSRAEAERAVEILSHQE